MIFLEIIRSWEGDYFYGMVFVVIIVFAVDRENISWEIVI